MQTTIKDLNMEYSMGASKGTTQSNSSSAAYSGAADQGNLQAVLHLIGAVDAPASDDKHVQQSRTVQDFNLITWHPRLPSHAQE